MSVTVNVGVTTSEKRALTKSFSTTVSKSGTLRNETNVVNPSILLNCSAESIATCNYMTIPDFGRKYFITDITAVTNELCIVSGHTDVLSTYASQIRANPAIIGRSSSNYNLYLDDNIFKVDSRTIVQTKKFSGSFDDTPSIILITVG